MNIFQFKVLLEWLLNSRNSSHLERKELSKLFFGKIEQLQFFFVNIHFRIMKISRYTIQLPVTLPISQKIKDLYVFIHCNVLNAFLFPITVRKAIFSWFETGWDSVGCTAVSVVMFVVAVNSQNITLPRSAGRTDGHTQTFRPYFLQIIMFDRNHLFVCLGRRIDCDQLPAHHLIFLVRLNKY